MTKKNFINVVAEKAEVTQKEAARVADAMLETISEVLMDHDRIQFPGFGTFETRERKARQGRNPITGEVIDIPAGTAPCFKASQTLKNSVNK